MVYISTFALIIKSLIHTQEEGWGSWISFIRPFSMFWIGLVFVFFVWERDCYQNIYSIGHTMYELVTLWEKSHLGFKMFTLPSLEHRLSFFPVPQKTPTVTPVKTCGSATGNREVPSRMYCCSSTSYLDHNKWLVFVLSLYLLGWHTGWWLMWTKHSKDDECGGKIYTPVFCWVSHNIKDHLLKPFHGSHSLNHECTFIYIVEQHAYLCLIRNSKRVFMNLNGSLQENSLSPSSVIATNWLEVLYLLLYGMLVCQGSLPHFLETFVGELAWSWEVL